MVLEINSGIVIILLVDNQFAIKTCVRDLIISWHRQHLVRMTSFKSIQTSWNRLTIRYMYVNKILQMHTHKHTHIHKYPHLYTHTHTHTHRLIKHVHIHISECIHYTQYSFQINIICTVPGTYFIRTSSEIFFCTKKINKAHFKLYI